MKTVTLRGPHWCLFAPQSRGFLESNLMCCAAFLLGHSVSLRINNLTTALFECPHHYAPSLPQWYQEQEAPWLSLNAFRAGVHAKPPLSLQPYWKILKALLSSRMGGGGREKKLFQLPNFKKKAKRGLRSRQQDFTHSDSEFSLQGAGRLKVEKGVTFPSPIF